MRRTRSVVTSRGRLPDFVLIGTMKSGTTTVFRWLEEHPDVRLPAVKEPNFFADDRHWREGTEWYARHFDGIPEEVMTGEASVAYTDPRWAAATAERLRGMLPNARLVCVLRHPVQRMGSHYRHEVQRGRERRRFAEATGQPDSPYVLRSCYASALQPWSEQFGPEQLHVVTAERLLSRQDEWDRLLDFLRLRPASRPESVHNVTDGKEAFSPAMRVLWDLGLAQRVPRLPPSVRRLGRRVLLRPTEHAAALATSVRDGAPAPVLERLRAETAELDYLFPHLAPGWELE